MNIAATNNLNFGKFVEIEKHVFLNTNNIKYVDKSDNYAVIYLKDKSLIETEIPYDQFIKNINHNGEQEYNPTDDFLQIGASRTINVNEILTIEKDEKNNTVVETLGGTRYFLNKKLPQFIADCSRKIKDANFINLQGKNLSYILTAWGIQEYNNQESYK